MNNLVKVVAVNEKGITFDDGTVMSSYHRRTARGRCYIDFSDLTLEMFNGKLFDLSSEETFLHKKRNDNYLFSTDGSKFPIPCWLKYNGTGSIDLRLLLENEITRRRNKYRMTDFTTFCITR